MSLFKHLEIAVAVLAVVAAIGCTDRGRINVEASVVLSPNGLRKAVVFNRICKVQARDCNSETWVSVIGASDAVASIAQEVLSV